MGTIDIAASGALFVAAGIFTMPALLVLSGNHIIVPFPSVRHQTRPMAACHLAVPMAYYTRAHGFNSIIQIARH